MIPANEALNFIMVIIIKKGFQVDVEIGGYLRKMVSHTAPYGPIWPQKRILGVGDGIRKVAVVDEEFDSAIGDMQRCDAPTPLPVAGTCCPHHCDKAFELAAFRDCYFHVAPCYLARCVRTLNAMPTSLNACAIVT